MVACLPPCGKLAHNSLDLFSLAPYANSTASLSTPYGLKKMQLNVERLQYHLAAALSEYSDSPPPPRVSTHTLPRPPRGDLKRPLQTRLSTLRHDQVRWIAPRLNMTMADFARRSIEAMIEHIVEANPQILFEDYPDQEKKQEDPQLDLFYPHHD